MTEEIKGLDFEAPILELERKIAQLEGFSRIAEIDLSDEITKLRARATYLKKDIYKNLTPWQRVLLARHHQRPQISDFIHLAFTDFVPLHGDRSFRDDPAMICGLARAGTHKVMLIGTRKGKNIHERVACHFGCPHPEGYHKALLKMKLAEKFNLPVVTLIDTPGAYPGIGAEERGQALIIAKNIFEMSYLRTSIVCVVIGEGGSGGALAIGVGDHLSILENAYFSVISPEGCAAILWKSNTKAPESAKVLKLTSYELRSLGIVDEIIPEPLGGAHRDYKTTSDNLSRSIITALDRLEKIPIDTLIQQRYEKYRKIGHFIEAPLQTSQVGQASPYSRSSPPEQVL
ncbi:MAG: acetyl-CoA carboxylase carboxyltransferase subunit alpha [Planctomycetota bacterium]|nr:acetyl-CoA carboxylase carboxyltransferase subunit alpha [Planctomycetota bacterium]MDI6787752.1 acetyl-CoA carboxylase carboxyltransferase subunit alpha [Planctomycetota bacterium]